MFLTVLQAQGQLRLVNVSGVNIFQENISGEGAMQKQIDLTGYPDGVYFLQIFSDKDNFASQCVIKNKSNAR